VGIAFSFRTKIAILAGVITGVIVLAASLLLWKLTYHFNLEGIDRDVRNIAHANMQRAVGKAHWQRLDESLAFVAGNDSNSVRYLIWVESRGRMDYVSSGWPEETNPFSSIPDWKVSKKASELPKKPLKNVPISGENPALPIVDSYIYNKYVVGKNWRIAIFNNYYTNLAIAVDVDSFEVRMNRLKRSYYLVAPGALILAISGAWFVARRSLRPVELLTRAVDRVTARGLGERIEEVGHEKEFHRLVSIFNDMMGRLEKSFHQARRFSADASHELKTPLARLQMRLEQALKTAPTDSDEQETYSCLLDDLSRLSGIVDKLTLLSSSDQGRLQLVMKKIDLGELLECVAEDWKAVAGDERVEVAFKGNAHVEADALLLEQALQNLTSNALKYGRSDGKLRLSLDSDSGHALVRVWNQGDAIGEEYRDKIFDRFYRANSSRGAQSGGGLGLSLSREIVRAHSGEISLERSDGFWTVFLLRLPFVV